MNRLGDSALLAVRYKSLKLEGIGRGETGGQGSNQLNYVPTRQINEMRDRQCLCAMHPLHKMHPTVWIAQKSAISGSGHVNHGSPAKPNYEEFLYSHRANSQVERNDCRTERGRDVLPPMGMTLHKGMSILAAPTEQEENLAKLAIALHAAKVIDILPIYPTKDKTIRIAVNRSQDTPEEAKQY
ncbi:MAG TPA: hypothetical protein VFE61_09475 [Candidatus Sulfotelmatobacter sp.]|nr:hypothetical protein [Candidatus Sulfotelmatobacter sp.]